MSFVFNPFLGNFDVVNPAFIDILSTASNTTMTSGKTYLVNTSGGAVNMTLPAPALNAFVTIKDSNGTALTNNITVVRNGSESIDGVAASYIMNSNFGSLTFASNGINWFLF